MNYNFNSNLWPDKTEGFFKNKKITPIRQSGPHCVSTTLAILTETRPEDFQNDKVNTQDPVSWSLALNQYGMKLAYCPFDVRKLKFYMDELILLDDLFLLCYYSPLGPEILRDPDERGWICGSHIVTLFRDKIIDSKRGFAVPARDHECNDHFTKRIFRIVPIDYPRGL